MCGRGEGCEGARGFPNRGERCGAKYENGVAYILSCAVSVEELWTRNARVIHDV